MGFGRWIVRFFRLLQIIESRITILLILLAMTGCVPIGAVPTVADIPSMQTAQFVTANAPPPNFSKTNQFAQIDANLEHLPNWHYTVTLGVDAVYTGTSTKTQGKITADIYSNELRGERRVVLNASGDAFNLKTESNVEGVRIGNNFYIVDQNRHCAPTSDPSAQKAALLTAKGLIGGIKLASSTLMHKTISEMPAWQYTFLPEDVNPPPLQLGDGGTISIASGDLWIAPSQNVVADYTLTLNVENTVVQGSKPLTGLLRVSYHLLETSVVYNISIPFGC